jgi:hypothetical protein
MRPAARDLRGKVDARALSQPGAAQGSGSCPDTPAGDGAEGRELSSGFARAWSNALNVLDERESRSRLGPARWSGSSDVDGQSHSARPPRGTRRTSGSCGGRRRRPREPNLRKRAVDRTTDSCLPYRSCAWSSIGSNREHGRAASVAADSCPEPCVGPAQCALRGRLDAGRCAPAGGVCLASSPRAA